MRRVHKGLLLAGALLAAALSASAGDGVRTVTKRVLSERLEVAAAQAAIDFCTSIKVHAHVVITNAKGEMRLLLIGDGGDVDGSVDAARRKAYTAAVMGQSTQVMAERMAAMAKPMTPPDANMLFMAGGLPIRAGEEVIGAIAVSGAMPEQDAKCAQAGLDKIQSELN
jgi:uncharacterized protein GlcG (DUF336 family)